MHIDVHLKADFFFFFNIFKLHLKWGNKMTKELIRMEIRRELCSTATYLLLPFVPGVEGGKRCFNMYSTFSSTLVILLSWLEKCHMMRVQKWGMWWTCKHEIANFFPLLFHWSWLFHGSWEIACFHYLTRQMNDLQHKPLLTTNVHVRKIVIRKPAPGCVPIFSQWNP